MSYQKAPETVVELVREVVAENHYRLQNSRIAVIMKDKATKTRGQVVLGTAEKFPDKLKPLTNINYDFLLAFAYDEWLGLDPDQKRALVDHELCHCEYNEEMEPTMRGHDVEEFIEIIERHGFWKPQLRQMANAIQGRLGFDEYSGIVGTLEVVE